MSESVCAKCKMPTKAVAVFAGGVGACAQHVSTVLAEFMEIRVSDAAVMLRDAPIVSAFLPGCGTFDLGPWRLAWDTSSEDRSAFQVWALRAGGTRAVLMNEHQGSADEIRAIVARLGDLNG